MEAVEDVLAGRRRWALVNADCRAVMAEFPAESVDSVVTDPPYGLEFMGKEWDRLWDDRDGSEGSPGLWKGSDGADRAPGAPGYAGLLRQGAPAAYVAGPAAQEWHLGWARAAFRVLKPGGWLLAMGGTRTYHRLACAVEDAGFEIRDKIEWLYGSGFPKSLDAERAVAMETCAQPGRHYSSNLPRGEKRRPGDHVCPETETSRRFEGMGTALKPSHEPVCVARKPMAGTLARNLLRLGTGALGVEATRVAFAGTGDESEAKGKNQHADFGSGPMTNRVYGEWKEDRPNWAPTGRWPPNVVLTHSPECERKGTKAVPAGSHYPDERLTGYGRNLGRGSGGAWRYDGEGPRPETELVEDWACAPGCPVAEIDRQSGVSESTPHSHDGRVSSHVYGGGAGMGDTGAVSEYADEGGASRFFPRFGWDDEERSLIYAPKASRSEREAGLGPGTGFAPGPMAGRGDGENPVGFRCRKCGRWKVSGSPCACPEPDFEGLPFDRPRVANIHPTVKPIALMRWLVRLVTPPGGAVLDPFAGSGTTGCGAVPDGFRFVGIEADEPYSRLATARIRYWESRPPALVPSHRLLRARTPGQLRLDGWAETKGGAG